MKPSEIERTKLTATYLNGLGIAAAAVGIFAPAVGLVTSSSQATFPAVTVLGATCLLLSFALHLFGRATLRGLDG